MISRNLDVFKYHICGALVMILCLCFTWTVYASDHVFDEADLFTYEECEDLEELASKLEDRYDMNFLTVTTDYADGMSSERYAEKFYVDGSYDTNGKKGGVVLLIDMDNRELCAVTHGDMIAYLTDDRIESIYDEGYDYASEGEYGSSMISMLEMTAQYMQEGIVKGQYTYNTETGEITRYHHIDPTFVLMAALTSLVVAVISCVVLWRKYSVVEEYQYSAQRNVNMKLTGKEDRLVNQFVTQRRIPRNPPPGDGGGPGMGDSFGRSSTHTGYGGQTFGGGGGRKF